nr:copper amine oxidase N-terminal domain-containing protein [Paenibacillus rhizovicinus]
MLLRFIGEQFGAVVDWDAKNNGLVVVTPDPTVQGQIRSGDLAQARLAVVRMPKISFYSSPEHPEGHANSYIFPENDYSKYYFQLNGSIFYYELKNGYMSLVWEGKLTVPS